jgi:hypothetical protein
MTPFSTPVLYKAASGSSSQPMNNYQDVRNIPQGFRACPKGDRKRQEKQRKSP